MHSNLRSIIFLLKIRLENNARVFRIFYLPSTLSSLLSKQSFTVSWLSTLRGNLSLAQYIAELCDRQERALHRLDKYKSWSHFKLTLLCFAVSINDYASKNIKMLFRLFLLVFVLCTLHCERPRKGSATKYVRNAFSCYSLWKMHQICNVWKHLFKVRAEWN